MCVGFVIGHKSNQRKSNFVTGRSILFQYYLQLHHRFRQMLSQNQLLTLRLSFPTEEEVCYVI